MATRGKRKRTQKKCSNVLFVKWLTEWKDDAEGKGWKSAKTYARVTILRSDNMSEQPFYSY